MTASGSSCQLRLAAGGWSATNTSISIQYNLNKVEKGKRSHEFKRIGQNWNVPAHRHCRRAGGSRTSPLPDFYIGAHAEQANLVLVTRDVARYRTYFSKVKLITPKD